jgi:hypothetical protein
MHRSTTGRDESRRARDPRRPSFDTTRAADNGSVLSHAHRPPRHPRPACIRDGSPSGPCTRTRTRIHTTHRGFLVHLARRARRDFSCGGALGRRVHRRHGAIRGEERARGHQVQRLAGAGGIRTYHFARSLPFLLLMQSTTARPGRCVSYDGEAELLRRLDPRQPYRVQAHHRHFLCRAHVAPPARRWLRDGVATFTASRTLRTSHLGECKVCLIFYQSTTGEVQTRR